MEKVVIKLSYSLLEPPLRLQIKKLGLKYDPKEMIYFEKDRKALYRLWYSNLLTDSMLNTMLPKLHKKVMQHLAKANKFTLEK